MKKRDREGKGDRYWPRNRKREWERYTPCRQTELNRKKQTGRKQVGQQTHRKTKLRDRDREIVECLRNTHRHIKKMKIHK